MANNSWAIGVDIGGTKINIASVDNTGKILRSINIPTRVEGGPKVIISDIIEAIQSLISDSSDSSPKGIGIGMAGQIDPKNGVILFAPNLEWYDVPLQSELHNALNLPVIITNDVRAATLGEWLYGAGKDCDDIVCLFIGTGIGGGIVSSGNLMTGSSNTAGELGHIVVDMNGPLCTCGNHGCFESYAGGRSLVKRTQEAIAAHPTIKHGLGNPKLITTKILIEGYRNQDPIAVQVIEKARQALIAGATSIVNGFNPKRLILEGGITHGLPEIIEWIDDGVKQHALKAATKSLQVIRGKHGNDAGVIGAAAFVLKYQTTNQHP